MKAVCRAIDSPDTWRINRLQLRLAQTDKPLVIHRVGQGMADLLVHLWRGTQPFISSRYLAEAQAGPSPLVKWLS